MTAFKTRQEVARELGISRRTLARIIKRLHLKIPPRRLLGPLEQQAIYSALLPD